MELFRYFAYHPEVGLTLTLLWYFWIAAALGIICFELHAHNSREDRNAVRRQFEGERQEPQAAANPFTQHQRQPQPSNPDAAYMPKK